MNERMTTIEDVLVQELKDVALRKVPTTCPATTPAKSGVPLRLPPLPSSRVDQDGLIIPKKISNPHIESKEAQDLNREIKWNARIGINVLATKSELQKAMEKRNLHKKIKERALEENLSKTPFQKSLEQRAKQLEQLEKCRNEENGHVSGDSGHCSPEPENEFQRVHAQLRGRNSAKV